MEKINETVDEKPILERYHERWKRISAIIGPQAEDIIKAKKGDVPMEQFTRFIDSQYMQRLVSMRLKI